MIPLLLVLAYAMLFLINTNHLEKRMVYALLTDGDWRSARSIM